MIIDECINCGVCELECLNNVIYEGGVEWCYLDGIIFIGMIQMLDGDIVQVDVMYELVDMDVYYIVFDKCIECKGFYDEFQCVVVCLVDCCVDDFDYCELEDELFVKKDFMYV